MIKLASLIKQMFAYFGVAACAAAVNIGGFFVLYNIFGINTLVATVLSSFIGSCVNFTIGRLTLFKHQTHKGKGIIRDFFGVIGSSAVGYGLDLIFMWGMIDILGFHPILGKIISTGLVFLWNFTAQRFLVYKQKEL